MDSYQEFNVKVNTCIYVDVFRRTARYKMKRLCTTLVMQFDYFSALS